LLKVTLTYDGNPIKVGEKFLAILVPVNSCELKLLSFKIPLIIILLTSNFFVRNLAVMEDIEKNIPRCNLRKVFYGDRRTSCEAESRSGYRI
jgi:hypothetical protein